MADDNRVTSTVWRRSRAVGQTLSRLGIDGIEGVVRVFVQQTEAAAARAEEALDELLVRTEMNRAQIAEQVRDETRASVEALGLASRDDIDHLRDRLDLVERQLAGLDPSEPGRSTAEDGTVGG